MALRVRYSSGLKIEYLGCALIGTEIVHYDYIYQEVRLLCHNFGAPSFDSVLRHIGSGEPNLWN